MAGYREALIKCRLRNGSNRASLWSGGFTRGRCPLVQTFHRLLIKASATKEIEDLGTKGDRQRIVGKILALAKDPRMRGSENLAGHENRYRVRQGQYRIIHLVDDGLNEVTIFKIGHRNDVYR